MPKQQQGKLVWIAAGNDEWVPGVMTAENVHANTQGRTDMRGQPLAGQRLVTCWLPDTGDSVTVPEATLRPRDADPASGGGGGDLGASLLGGGGTSPAASPSRLLGGAKAKAQAIQARIASPQQQAAAALAQRSPGQTGVLGEVRAVREEAVLTIKTTDGEVEINATVAAFGERVARLSNVPLILAYPPLADAALTNAHEIRGAVAVIARGAVPFVEKARRAQAADAVGVIFINETDEPYVALGMDGDSDIVLPVVCVRRSDGETLHKKIAASKGVRHHCTASLSFGNSVAVSNELEAFLNKNPAGAENIRDSARKKMDLAGRALESAKGGLKGKSPGKQSLMSGSPDQYQNAPADAADGSSSPPRSSAAIVGEWMKSKQNKPAPKTTGGGGFGAGKAGGLGMGLQTVDDSIYNQPQPTLAAAAPAPMLPQVDSIYGAAAPQAPMQAAAPPTAAAPAQSQKSFTQLLSQHIPATKTASAPAAAAAVAPDGAILAGVAQAPAAVSPSSGAAAAAQHMEALEAATANASAFAEANARQLQQRHDQQLHEIQNSSVQELERNKEGARVAIAASNARTEAERVAHAGTSSALQSERDAHGSTREQLASAGNAQSQLMRLQEAKTNVEQEVAGLQEQLDETRSANLALERERDLQPAQENASTEHLAFAVSSAVAEANQTWEAKLQTLQRGFEYDLQEAESQLATYKDEMREGLDRASPDADSQLLQEDLDRALDQLSAASQAAEESQKAAEVNLQATQKAHQIDLGEQASMIKGLQYGLAQAQGELQLEKEQSAQQIAAAKAEVAVKSTDSGVTPPRQVRNCADCGEERANGNFSSNQWKRGQGTSRCSNCVDASPAPSAVPAVASVADSDAKLQEATASFESRLAAVQTHAAADADAAEQKLAAVTSELAQWLERDIRAEIQVAVDAATVAVAASTQQNAAAMEDLRQTWQADLAAAKAKALAADRSVAEATLAAERAKIELTGERSSSGSSQAARLQEVENTAAAKLQAMQKAHSVDVAELAEAEKSLEAELATSRHLLQRSKSEAADELGKLQKLIAEKDAEIKAAEERDDVYTNQIAEMSASHQATAQANLDRSVRTMQAKIDEANSSQHQTAAQLEKAASAFAADSDLLKQQLQQAQAAFVDERNQLAQQKDKLTQQLERATTQQREMGEQLVGSEQLVTEMSAELERVQLEQSVSGATGDAQIEQAKTAFRLDLETAEAAATEKLTRVKDAARQKLEETMEARKAAEASLALAAEEHRQMHAQAQQTQQNVAAMTAKLSQAEATLSEKSFDQNKGHRELSEAKQQIEGFTSELTKVRQELEAERVASETNQAVSGKVADEMALALEAAHLKSDAKVQQARQAFQLDLEEAEAEASRRLVESTEESTRKLIEAEQAFQTLERQHTATKEKLLGYLDNQDHALDLESQVEQLEAELVETARQLGVKDDHNESVLERTNESHAEALRGLEAKLESLGGLKSEAELSSEDALARLHAYEQGQAGLDATAGVKGEEMTAELAGLRSELELARDDQTQLRSELEQAKLCGNVSSADMQQRLDGLAKELEQSQKELFQTAEAAVGTEVTLKDELQDVSAAHEESERKLAADASEQSKQLAEAVATGQAAQHEVDRLRAEAAQKPAAEAGIFAISASSTAQIAAIEAEKTLLEASVEGLNRQLRLTTADKEELEQQLLAAKGELEQQLLAATSSLSMILEPAAPSTGEEEPARQPQASMSPRTESAVVDLQAEMESLRSQLHQRADDNQSLQQQIDQLHYSHQQLAADVPVAPNSPRAKSPHLQQRAAYPQPVPAAPTTPERAAAAGVRSPDSGSIARSQDGSPVRDHAAELETLEVMVHALRQEASVSTTPTHSERGGSSQPSRPNSRPGSPAQSIRSESHWDLANDESAFTIDSGAFDSAANHRDEYDDDRAVDAPRRLCEAVASGAGAVVKMLVQDRYSSNALWDRADGATLLHAAAFNGHAHVASHLLAFEANVDRPMVNGATAIFAAAQQGHVDVLDELLAAGATVNWVSDDGSTPLYVAAWKGHADVVARLLGYGAHADRYHRERATPLFVAAQEGHAAVVQVLLRAGADPRRPWQDAHGRRWSAMDKALANRHSAVVAILRETQQGGRRSSLGGSQRGTPPRNSPVSQSLRSARPSPSQRTPGSLQRGVASVSASPRRPSPLRRHSARQVGGSSRQSDGNGWR